MWKAGCHSESKVPRFSTQEHILREKPWFWSRCSYLPSSPPFPHYTNSSLFLPSYTGNLFMPSTDTHTRLHLVLGTQCKNLCHQSPNLIQCILFKKHCLQSINYRNYVSTATFLSALRHELYVYINILL